MRVSVAIITCKRPASLQRLLDSLGQLETPDPLDLIVVDNDPLNSASHILNTYRGRHRLTALHEPTQGIPYARNTALRACSAESDFIAFLDDDEEVRDDWHSDWLGALLKTIVTTGADAVGGPVHPLYPEATPDWVIKGRFFERSQKPDQQACRMLATNNCLIRAATWRANPVWFDTRLQFTGSSDTLFFLNCRKSGWLFAWSAKAHVYEHVQAQRLNARWIIQRQYRIGNGLSLCEVMTFGYLRAAVIRIPKSAAHFVVGLLHLLRLPVYGYAAWVAARASWARGTGGLTALLGQHYEEYAPGHLIGENR